MIRDPRSESFSELWSVIRDPDYFFSCDPRSVIQTIFSMIRSALDQIISLVMMIILQFQDHFYGSRIIFADHGSFLRIPDHFADRGLFDVAEKWSAKMHLIRFISYDPWSAIRIILGHDPQSAIRIILGSMIRDPRSGSFFWRSGPLLLQLGTGIHLVISIKLPSPLTAKVNYRRRA